MLTTKEKKAKLASTARQVAEELNNTNYSEGRYPFGKGQCIYNGYGHCVFGRVLEKAELLTPKTPPFLGNYEAYIHLIDPFDKGHSPVFDRLEDLTIDNDNKGPYRLANGRAKAVAQRLEILADVLEGKEPRKFEEV